MIWSEASPGLCFGTLTRSRNRANKMWSPVSSLRKMVEVLWSRSMLQVSICCVKPSEGMYVHGKVVEPIHSPSTWWTADRSRRALQLMKATTNTASHTTSPILPELQVRSPSSALRDRHPHALDQEYLSDESAASLHQVKAFHGFLQSHNPVF